MSKAADGTFTGGWTLANDGDAHTENGDTLTRS
jgi:hypothetical protein